jgi:hypothetical protein
MCVAYHRVANARNLAESKPWTDQQHPFDAVPLIGAETLGTVAGQTRYDVQIVDFSLQIRKFEFDVDYFLGDTWPRTINEVLMNSRNKKVSGFGAVKVAEIFN